MIKIPLVFHPIYSQLKLPRNHRFPIEKYLALKQAAQSHFADSIVLQPQPEPITLDALQTVHSNAYINSFVSGEIDEKAMKRIGFPWSEQFVQRTLTAVGGTLKTAEIASEVGIAINCTGGYHHAHPEFGSGFCVFNDLVIAANHLLDQHSVSRVLIFDCDVHQGDGTAVCAQNTANIFTVSLHCEKNFPARKQQSDWDVGLDRHLDDEQYLHFVASTLNAAIDSFKPDFIIYDAGVDIHQDDDLGHLNVTTEGIYRRDQLVFRAAKDRDIAVMAVIGGGYQRDIDALTEVHLQLVRAAVNTFAND